MEKEIYREKICEKVLAEEKGRVTEIEGKGERERGKRPRNHWMKGEDKWVKREKIRILDED